MNNPKCSVCIANYNGIDVIGPCLESLCNQDSDVPIEIIIHDDASTDGSVEFIRKNYPGVLLLTSEKNIGFCASNNRMVDAAQGEYVLILNNDLELHKNAIKTLYNFSRENDKTGILTLPQYNAGTGDLIDIGELLDPFMNAVPNKSYERNNVAMVIGACMWMKKSLWIELGGFPEWFESLAEDMYLCCVARLMGYPVIALADSGYDHWVGKSLGGGKVVENRLQTSFKRRSLSERNKSFVLCLYYPTILLSIILPLHLILLIVEGIALSLVKKDPQIFRKIYVSCLRSLWLQRRRIINLRRIIQKQSIIPLRQLLSCHTCVPYKLNMLMKYGLPFIE